MAGVEVDLVQRLFRLEVDAARRHEPQGPVDLARDRLVATSLLARGHELLVPQVHLAEVGETALGEGAHEVQRGRRLVVGGHHPSRVGDPGRGVGGVVVDDVAAERRHLESPTRSVGDDRGLANCPAMRPTLTTGTPAP